MYQGRRRTLLLHSRIRTVVSDRGARMEGATKPAARREVCGRTEENGAGAAPRGSERRRSMVWAVTIDRHPVPALILASAMWGGAVSAVKFALGGFDALTLLTIELLAATTVLWAALIAGGYRPPRSWTVEIGRAHV